MIAAESFRFLWMMKGYLIDPTDWNRVGCIQPARKRWANTYPKDHWRVILIHAQHDDEHRVAADARFIIKHLAEMIRTTAEMPREYCSGFFLTDTQSRPVRLPE